MDRKRLIRYGFWAVIAVLAAVLLISLLDNGDDNSSSSSTTAESESSTGAVIVTPEELREKAAEHGAPVYWAGEQEGAQIEYSEPESGRIYVRYLTGGAEAGDPDTEFLTIGTYEFENAAQALKKQAQQPNGVLASAPGGGVVFFNSTHPESVYLAYPGEEVQVEVYDPNPKRSIGLVSSGLVIPVS
jgi:hypothetical protein